MAAKSDFPAPAAKLNGTDAWLCEDIEDFREDGVWKRRKQYCDQDKYVESSEAEKLLSQSRNRIKKNIAAARWDKIPRPAGKVGRQWYWRRSAVEAWLSERSKNSEQ